MPSAPGGRVPWPREFPRLSPILVCASRILAERLLLQRRCVAGAPLLVKLGYCLQKLWGCTSVDQPSAGTSE